LRSCSKPAPNWTAVTSIFVARSSVMVRSAKRSSR
jgi:hypothetical protein